MNDPDRVGTSSNCGNKNEDCRTHVEGKRRLVVCCDGTWNDSISTESPITNVSRISRLIKAVGDDGVPQILSYQPGIGSGTSKLGSVIDGMTGRGISTNIREAYSFISHNYTSALDEIILIGFSRGAYTVRCIASFISDVGLLTKDGLKYLPRLYDLWKRNRPFKVIGGITIDPRSELRESCQEVSQKGCLLTGVRVRVCAVWDTIGSLGIPMPWPIPQGTPKTLGHINSTLCGNIDIAIQALALNESRRHFQPTVWEAPPQESSQILIQCWFLGAHSDVGGGNMDLGLANITLVWMISQLHRYVSFDLGNLDKSYAYSTLALPDWNITKPMVLFIYGFIFEASQSRLGTAFAIKYLGITLYSKIFNKPTVREYVRDNVSSSKGIVRNSMRGVFRFGGSKKRRPGRYLITEKGVRKIAKDEPVSTNETIHFSVRVLLGTRSRTCPALANYKTNIVNNEVIWRLSRKNGNETRTTLREETFTQVEEDLLRQCLNADKLKSDDIAWNGVPDQVREKGKAKDASISMPLGAILHALLAEARDPKTLFPSELNKPVTHVTDL